MNLVKNLENMGLGRGDLVMLHASLRALGLAKSQGVEDGAKLLLEALEHVVGHAGTLLMVLGTDYPMDWVNQQPVEARHSLLKDAPHFDYRNAAVLPEVGYFAEFFRRQPGTIVSNNPSGRFGARGARAEEILREQPWNDYYGPGSPLERLCNWNGRILRLGADTTTVTALHLSEYRANVQNKIRTRWDFVVDISGKPEHVSVDCLNDSDGIYPWKGEDYFSLILKDYLACQRHREATVANAKAELIDAADIVEFGAKWMEAHFTHPPSP